MFKTVLKNKGRAFVRLSREDGYYQLSLLFLSAVADWFCVAREVVSEKCFQTEREAAVADFVPICRKIDANALSEKDYETRISFEPCHDAELSLVMKAVIGTLEVRKKYPISLERYALEVFGITDIWNPENYLNRKAPF